MAAHLPSLQLATELPDSTKGGAKGYVVVRGAWAGLLGHPERPFSPNYSLVLPGVQDCCPLRRQYVTLLTARNLMAVVWESREYIINILPRKLPKKVVPREHYILKDLPFYKEVQQADAEKRRALLDDRERRKNEGTLRKALGKKTVRILSSGWRSSEEEKEDFHKGKEVEIPPPPKEVVIPPSTYVKRPFGTCNRRSHINKSTRLPLSGCGCGGGFLCGRIASCGNPNGGNGGRKPGSAILRAKPSCPCTSEGASLKETEFGAEPKVGLLGRLQDRFQETIEVSCSSVQDDHSEGSETEMATEIPAVLMVVPDEGMPERLSRLK
ncbi:hypothetical protein CK203_037254 [Vitis vinifera]|uniref:Uncharacterized protein n=1 Tax=Vitis vinifera TaxID=29760 RepID=A0A438HS80_VITVI|nr:hypothetical protein CK203_037254 [Vitis vinifera]